MGTCANLFDAFLKSKSVNTLEVVPSIDPMFFSDELVVDKVIYILTKAQSLRKVEFGNKNIEMSPSQTLLLLNAIN